MRVIYKYELNEALPVCEVRAPIVKPLKVDFQNGKPFLWAVVDTAAAEKTIHIYRVGTGFPLHEGFIIGSHLNTTVLQSEPYVWHWFWDCKE